LTDGDVPSETIAVDTSSPWQATTTDSHELDLPFEELFCLPRTEVRRIHLIGPGSDSFALSLPSWRCRHRLAYRVFPDRRPTTPHRVIWAPSMGFGCSPEHRTTTGYEAPKHSAPASRGIRLLGMPCLRPIREPSTPRRRFRLPSASTCNSANTFRPRGFSPPRRLTPVPGPSILQLDTEQGSLCFSAEPPDHNKAETSPDRRLAHPHSAVHTPRRIPLASSRTVSPRPLPLLSFAYATGLFIPPPLQSFPNNDEDRKKHLPELRAPKSTALACRQLPYRVSEDLTTRDYRCAPVRRSVPSQHRSAGLSRSTSGLYSTDESVLCGPFPIPPQPILPWALFPSKVPLFPIHARHLTVTETHDKAEASRAALHPSSGFAHQPASQPARPPLESVRVRSFPQRPITR